MVLIVVVQLLDGRENYFSLYWWLICPTGRWFWLWRRDLPKPVSLANARAPTTAAVAQHIFTTLMTPTHTDTSSHFTRGQRKHHYLCHPGCLQQNIFISISIFQMPKGAHSQILGHSQNRDTFTVLSCTHFHDVLLSTGARVRANQTL